MVYTAIILNILKYEFTRFSWHILVASPTYTHNIKTKRELSAVRDSFDRKWLCAAAYACVVLGVHCNEWPKTHQNQQHSRLSCSAASLIMHYCVKRRLVVSADG